MSFGGKSATLSPAKLSGPPEDNEPEPESYVTTLSGTRELLKLTLRHIKTHVPDHILNFAIVDFLFNEVDRALDQVIQQNTIVITDEEKDDEVPTGGVAKDIHPTEEDVVDTPPHKKAREKENIDHWRPIKYYPLMPTPDVSPIGSPVKKC